MSLINSLIACPKIQGRLDAFFPGYNPAYVRENLAELDFLFSQFNRGGLDVTISPGNGKIRTAQVRYKQRIQESAVSTSAVQVCASDVQRGFLVEDYDLDITQGVEINEFFDMTELAEICESNEDYINENIMMMIDAAKRKMATILWTKTAGLTGAFGAGEENVAANVKSIQTKKANGDIDPYGSVDVEYAISNIGFPANPVLFGWGEPYKYYRIQEAGCCANSGLDLSQVFAMNSYAFLPDRRSVALGTDNFVAIAPGALQVLTFNQFQGAKGISVMDDDSYKQTIIYDPEAGIPFDLMMKIDCGKLHIQIKLAFDLVGLPADMFASGDRLEDVNFVLQFEVVNP